MSPPTKPEARLRAQHSWRDPKPLGFIPLEFCSSDLSQDLRDTGARNGNNAHRESQNQEWQQANSLAPVIESRRRSNFKERSEVSNRTVGRDRQERDDAVERGHSLIEQTERQDPADKQQ